MNEVKLNDGDQSTVNVGSTAVADDFVVEDPEDNDDKDWVSLTEASESLSLPDDGSNPQTISEQIAQVRATQTTIRVSIHFRQF